MPKIDLLEIRRAIENNKYRPPIAWQFASVELKEVKNTCFGKMEKYDVVVAFDGGLYNRAKYQVNYYIDENSYGCYYDGEYFE